MKCPKCHHENPRDSTFCGKCAAELGPSPEARIGVTETLETPQKELATGSVFAGRYQIIEELGRGGMGRVYRALDKKLDEEVALKLIRSEIAADRSTLERFHNELKLARKISHPHVGRMYELMEEKGTHFITMEYVPGQDLRGLIRQTGQLTVGKAIAIGKEIAEGLTEAHKQGIVHRDLKPSNIIINRAGNARIMDFGIARSMAAKSLTGPGVMIGTPEYMSPEQVEGKDVDTRSDIYSLGIILYEMLTGRVPFEGDTPFTVGIKHKSEHPKDPKLLNPNIPDDLSGLVLKCLEKEKSDRYQRSFDLLSALKNIEQGIPTTDRFVPARKAATSREITVRFTPKKLLIPALAIIAVVAAAILFWPTKTSNLDPNLIAVAVFENQTGDSKLDSIGSRAAALIMQGLETVGEFSVAPRPPAEALAAASTGKDNLRALAEVTKAGKIVHGHYYLQRETIWFHAWVQDMTANRNILTLEPSSGASYDPAGALEPLRLRLMGGLASFFNPVLKEFFLEGEEPPNFRAYREYIEGLKAFQRGDYPKAIDLLHLAAEYDPSLKMALIIASTAYWNQGRHAEAEALAREIDASRAALSDDERRILDWQLAKLRGDLEAALRAIRATSSTSAPVLYSIALESNRNNLPHEAIEVLAEYDPYSEGMKAWSRNYWWVLTTSLHMLGDFKRELKEARRARRQLPESLGLLAGEVDALAALGRIRDLEGLFEESKTLPPQGGYSPGNIMLRAGRELRAHGFREDSSKVLNEALLWFESRPAEEKASEQTRYNLAGTLYAQNKWVAALPLFERLRSEFPENMHYLGYTGATAARMGDKERALKISAELEGDARPYLFGAPTHWRARIAALLGDKEGAVSLLRQSFKQGYDYTRLHPCEDFESLADFPPFVQFMKPKG